MKKGFIWSVVAVLATVSVSAAFIPGFDVRDGLTDVIAVNGGQVDLPAWADDLVEADAEKAAFSLKIAEPLDYSFDIGLTDYELKVADDNRSIEFKGKMQMEEGFFPEFVKVTYGATDEVNVSGVFSEDFTENRFELDGNYSIAAGLNAGGLSLGDLETEAVKLKVSKDGVLFEGDVKEGGSASFYAGVSFGAGENITAFFPRDPQDWYLSFGESEKAKFTLFGVALKTEGESESFKISAEGIDVKANFYTGSTNVEMSGKIDSRGVNIEGKANVDLKLSLAGNVVDKVTDGAICGYQTVKDGALCGYNSVTSAAICGSDTVKNGAECGYHTVTSGAECGYHTIKSGAECGYKTITCWLNPLKWGHCKKPKSCRRAKSCKVAKHCELPKTCTDYNSPKSCQDLSKPKTCERHHLGDYIGDLKGDIVLSITDKGLKVAADASYCAKKECDKVAADTSYHAGPPMQVCFDVKALHGFESASGKACAEF